MTNSRQVGYSTVAAIPGDSNNVQTLLLGNDDALPYLIWQNVNGNKGQWSACPDPLITSRPKGFDTLAMSKGYDNILNVALIDKETKQPYLLQQATNGSWSDKGFLLPFSENSTLYSQVIMAQGNNGNLQVLLLGMEDGAAHLIWQNNANGEWQSGSLPSNPGVVFNTMAVGADHHGNLQSIWLDSNGKPWLLWQDHAKGTWLWWDQFPVDPNVSSYKAVTIHQGRKSALQVVLLSTDSGAPYLTWLDRKSKKWTYGGKLPTPSACSSFSAVTSGYGRNLATQYLSILLLGQDNKQVFELAQDPISGAWYACPQISFTNDHPAGFSAFAACSGYQQNLNVVLIAANNGFPFLIYEEDQVSSTNGLGIRQWQWYGRLPLPAAFMVETFYTPPLSIAKVLSDNNIVPNSTPGNVAICLSGGGSRAMTAGMGQLQALSTLSINGKSLLSQAKAISTVSGGSWVGMSYCYLSNHAITDQDFLGSYIEPHSWTTVSGTSSSVNEMASGTLIGARATSPRMSMRNLIAAAAVRIAFFGTSPSMVWQVLIAENVLREYGLYSAGSYGYPNSSFTYNKTTLDAILNLNASLEYETFNFVASQEDTGRTPRPFPICNMSMAVMMPNDSEQNYAAPVQGTPFYTGIVNYLQAIDANHMRVGGGLCQSFAFNSFCKSLDTSTENFLVDQPRQWSIADMVGVSSAAIGAFLWEIIGTTDEYELNQILDDYARTVQPEYPELLTVDANGQTCFTDTAKAQIWDRVQEVTTNIDVLTIPQYYYWSPRNTYPDKNQGPTRFADGGFLENTGVGGALSYSDIDSLIVFVNSGEAFESTTYGVVYEGQMLPNTNYKVDDQIAVLFGYQAYDKNRGYISYAQDHKGGTQSVCQLFPSSSFGPLLQGLAAAGSGETNGETIPGYFSHIYPCTFLQTLTTVDNPWFSVTAGRTVKVLWCYLNDVRTWHGLLATSVENLFTSSSSDDGLNSNFPHYSTITETQLTPAQVNMLANLSAWCVCGENNSAPFINLFK
ncbi:MAG: hypothetical protein NTV43_14190 [Methylococcales bacterium]|nr:hypothetical protein [Methylococcales bacterium]